jgi:hypothetical protein
MLRQRQKLIFWPTAYRGVDAPIGQECEKRIAYLRYVALRGDQLRAVIQLPEMLRGSTLLPPNQRISAKSTRPSKVRAAAVRHLVRHDLQQLP